MKIMIDIPEVYYDALKQANVIISGRRSGRTLESAMYNAVGNGTPLDIVFEDIKAEIKGECNNRENVKDDEIEIGVSLGLEKALKIIDKHIGGEQK